MAGGGARPGAGRPKGGISELSRILQEGGVDGLAALGAEKGIEGSREERARGAVGLIVRDMCKAGRGDDVLRFLATLTAQKAKAEGQAGGSVLIMALKDRPDLLPDGTGAALVEGEAVREPSAARLPGRGDADYATVQNAAIEPHFSRQFALGLE